VITVLCVAYIILGTALDGIDDRAHVRRQCCR
jgi:hypothetical protein